jgi:hypothetical protein
MTWRFLPWTCRQTSDHAGHRSTIRPMASPALVKALGRSPSGRWVAPTLARTPRGDQASKRTDQRFHGRSLAAWRLVRLGAANAGLGAIRENAEAEAARKLGDHERAGRHEAWAASYQAMRERYRTQEETFAQTMGDRYDWERATQQSRHLAVAADAELRRRHPDQKIKRLRSAEPDPVSDPQREKLTLAPDKNIGEMADWVHNLAVQRQAFREKLEERQALKVPSEDPDFEDLGPAFTAWNPPEKDAILQPPKPEITPSAKILELAREPEADWETGD